MKSVLKSWNVDEPKEEFHLGATITVILLFLAFMGASFYILIDTYA